MANQKIHEYPIERFVYGDDDYYDVDFWDGLVYQTAKIKGSTIKSAMLTGIAINLTAPSAFIVGGSPTDGTGTLTLTGAGLANQYIRGDGTLATLPTSGGGGNSVNYYLNGGTAASVALYYQMSKTAVIGVGVDFSLAGNGLISQWLTDVNDPNVTEIPAGNWNFEMYFSASSSGGVPKFYVELLKYDGATFTTIANNSATPEAITSGTAIDLYLTSVAVPLTPLTVTDRLALRVYIVDSVIGRTIINHTQNSHLCQVITTFSSGVSSINGLTNQTQYLAVGTSGTDFAINSATDTHKFNLPTASATNRGALSSANWSTFNGKQNAITLTTTGTGAATFVADTLNIPTPAGGSGIFGIPNASGVYTYYATLTLAMAAAVSGNTIEMFADVTETGAVTITLKNGVNINGNGHTYTLNTATTSNAFIDGGVAVVMNISNITIVRKGAGAGALLGLSMAANRIVGFSTFLKVESNSSFGITNYGGAVFSGYINGFTVTATGTNSTGIYLIRANIDGCNSVATNNGIQLVIGTLTNSYGESTGAGAGIDISNSGYASNCNGKSNTGYGISTQVTLSNSTGYSAGNYGIYAPSSAFLNNCTGISASSQGIWGNNNRITNCSAISTGSYASLIQNGVINNSSFYSSVNSGLNIFNSTTVYNSVIATLSGATTVVTSNASGNACLKNCSIINDWNNAGGHGIPANASLIVSNCSIKVANVSANCLNSASAVTMKYANNAFEGATVAVNVNITQGITNISDTKGNIII